MRFQDHNAIYFQRMDAAVEQKSELIDWVLPGDVAEFGPGSGSLTERIIARPGVQNVLALDASTEAVALLSDRFKKNAAVEVRLSTLGEDADPFSGRKFSTIVASSVFHEVYSFLGEAGLELITAQLVDALEPGGRFILRDGVKPNDPQAPARMAIAPRLLELAERYAAEGPKGLRPKIEYGAAYGTRHQIAELAFTITWGGQSFAREAQEQYQLYTLAEGELFYSDRGLNLIHCEAGVQPGYMEHLDDCPMETAVEKGQWTSWFPDSNGLWVFEKPRR